MDRSRVKLWLDDALKEFNHRQYLSSDPIEIVHAYSSREDQELVAVLAALFSYGRVRSIKEGLRRTLSPLGPTPQAKLLSLSVQEIEKIWEKSYYRFYSPRDIQVLLLGCRQFLNEFGSFHNGIKTLYSREEVIYETILKFRNVLAGEGPKTCGQKFMFADPYAGAAKRWHMLFRWMVRKDEVDLGCWDFIERTQLKAPLDTHLFEIAVTLGLTDRKTNGQRAVEDVSNAFLEFSPEDPLRYDFALCRIGILGLKDERLRGLFAKS